MNPNSAYKLEKIIPGNDYSNTTSTLFALHCTKTNEKPVHIKLLGDSNFTIFPPESFIQGAVYSLYLRELGKESDVEFIGYLYDQKPFSL